MNLAISREAGSAIQSAFDGFSGFDRPLARIGGSLSSVLRAEFVQNGVNVVIDGPLADEQPVGDLGVAMTNSQQFQDFVFTSSQTMRICAGFRPVPAGLGCMRRRNGAASRLPGT